MRRLYTTLLFLSLALAVVAQTTITNATFPVVGDTLKTSIDLGYSDFDANKKGADITWDFSGLQPSQTIIEAFVEATEGDDVMDYPTANLLRKTNTGQATYLKADKDSIVEVGIAGLDPAFNTVEIKSKISGQATYRRAPIHYQDTFSTRYSYFAEIPVSELPDSIQAIFKGLVTDIRVKIGFEENNTADAWGRVILPDARHNVLRLKRESLRTTEVTLKLFGLTWVNILDVGNQVTIPDFVTELVQPVTSTNYIFLSNNAKEEVVNVGVDSLGTVVSTRFKVNEVTTSTYNQWSGNGELSVYPNPTYGSVTFSLHQMPVDRYKIEMYDILGRKVWGTTTKYGQSAITQDFSGMRRGTYLYRVYNSKGKKLTTKRLMIVRP